MSQRERNVQPVQDLNPGRTPGYRASFLATELTRPLLISPIANKSVPWHFYECFDMPCGGSCSQQFSKYTYLIFIAII